MGFLCTLGRNTIDGDYYFIRIRGALENHFFVVIVCSELNSEKSFIVIFATSHPVLWFYYSELSIKF